MRQIMERNADTAAEKLEELQKYLTERKVSRVIDQDLLDLVADTDMYRQVVELERASLRYTRDMYKACNIVRYMFADNTAANYIKHLSDDTIREWLSVPENWDITMLVQVMEKHYDPVATHFPDMVTRK